MISWEECPEEIFKIFQEKGGRRRRSNAKPPFFGRCDGNFLNLLNAYIFFSDPTSNIPFTSSRECCYEVMSWKPHNNIPLMISWEECPEEIFKIFQEKGGRRRSGVGAFTARLAKGRVSQCTWSNRTRGLQASASGVWNHVPGSNSVWEKKWYSEGGGL